jgi:hypothetical protein
MGSQQIKAEDIQSKYDLLWNKLMEHGFIPADDKPDLATITESDYRKLEAEAKFFQRNGKCPNCVD